MISDETRHFNVNRILLLAVGLWPYKRSKFTRFQMILSLSIVTSFIFFQITVFITADLSFTFVINVVSSLLGFITVVINYSSFWSNAKNMKCLLEQLEHIYNKLEDENEVAIIERYESNAKNFTILFTSFSVISCFCLFTEPLWLRIPESYLAENITRADQLLHIITEYFVDQEKYCYIILLHMNAAVLVGLMVALSTGSMLIVYVKCACGMFRIASYRIERALTSNMEKSISLERDVVIYRNIIYAVDIHRKAMQFIEFLTSSFETFFCFFLIAIVISASLNLYGVISVKEDATKLLPFLLRASVCFFCMFIANYSGQEIIDHNNHVFFTAYNVHWYKASLRIQKTILFLLQRGNKPFKVNFGGVFTSSLDGFATAANTSISYFTVMCSVS